MLLQQCKGRKMQLHYSLTLTLRPTSCSLRLRWVRVCWVNQGTLQAKKWRVFWKILERRRKLSQVQDLIKLAWSELFMITRYIILTKNVAQVEAVEFKKNILCKKRSFEPAKSSKPRETQSSLREWGSLTQTQSFLSAWRASSIHLGSSLIYCTLLQEQSKKINAPSHSSTIPRKALAL